MLDLLWKHDLKDYIPRTNYTMSSIARMPYTNNWRVGDIRRDCVRCTVPNTSGQNGVEVSYRRLMTIRNKSSDCVHFIFTADGQEIDEKYSTITHSNHLSVTI